MIYFYVSSLSTLINKSKLTGFLLLIIFVLASTSGFAQTKGLIVDPVSVSGRSVLDFNNDGYVSTSTAGFSTDDIIQSEIPFKPLTLPSSEPMSDVVTGPACGFTDFADASSIDPVSTYLDGNGNWLFRFRLGGIAPNSKGYSILIDTDNKFGSTGTTADPNYISGNPGFEVEIELVTNFGVRLYDVDGKNAGTISLKTTLPYDDYAQKSIALTTNCGTSDYFYDFYIPFSVITGYFPTFTSSTPVRMVANTVISTQSAIQGPISDIAGVNDTQYGGNTEQAWTSVINSQVPTSTNTSGSYPPVRSAAPVVSGPIASGATSISGTSTEADGTQIKVYVNGIQVGTATVTGGTWTLNGVSPLAANATVNATATAPGKSESLISNTVIVGATCSVAPVISCATTKGIQGTATAGSTVRIYSGSGLVGTVTADAAGNFLYRCNATNTGCSSGSPCMADGTYWATMQESGKCESVASNDNCIGYNSNATTPSITTSPVYTSTTSITVATNTAVATRLRLFANGKLIGVTAGTITTSHTFTGLTLTLGQSLTAIAEVANRCFSSASTAVTVLGITAPPVVSGPQISAGATSVSGTSTEAAGTVITVYRNGVSIGTTTVDAYGNWTLSGLAASTLTAGNNITATAQATGKIASSVSNTVPVVATTTNIPVITGSYKEGDTSVSGTSASPNGTPIKVYIDGVLLGTTTVSNGTWSLTGLSASHYELYAGGMLTATAVETGRTESARSNTVMVACVPAVTTKTMNSPTICYNSVATITLTNSEAGVIYTLRNSTNTMDMGSSVLGTGDSIKLASLVLTGSQTLTVSSLKVSGVTCSNIQANTSTVTVNPYANTDNTVAASPVCVGNSATVTINNSQSGFTYQLRDDSNNSTIGSAVAGTGGSIMLNTGTLSSSGSNTYNILVVGTSPTNCSTQLTNKAVVVVGCASLYASTSAFNIDTYTNGQNLATVADPDGSVTAAVMAGGSLPPGTSLNAATGQVTVTNPAALVAGSYTFDVQTTDASGGITTQSVTININPDAESVYAAPVRKTVGSFTDGESITTVSDANGSLASVTLTAGSLPPGTSLDATTGQITVTDRTLLVPGTYNLSIRTVDAEGGITIQGVTIIFDPVVILPVVLLEFKATIAANGVMLDWSTASESANEQFIVERSGDGASFTAIGSVKGMGDSRQQHRYSFLDATPLPGINYYRLKEISSTSEISFSKTLVVEEKIAGGKVLRLKLYPNPATTVVNPGIDYDRVSSEDVMLILTDLSGRVVFRRTVKAGSTAQQYQLDLSGLSAGTYVVQVQGAQVRYVGTVVKQD